MTLLERQQAEALRICAHVLSGQETNKATLNKALELTRAALKEFARQARQERQNVHY